EFDPDTARSALLENPWNHRRFGELGDLLAAVCLDVFEKDAARGWATVPLARDCPRDATNWLVTRYREDVITACQRRLRRELRLVSDGANERLDRLAFEEDSLDGLLTVDDQKWLAPDHKPLPFKARDRHGRWRRVLGEIGQSRVIRVKETLE